MKNNPILYHTFWFWAAILGPSFFAIWLAGEIFQASPDLRYSMHYNDINYLVIAYRTPLGFLSLTIPFVAVVAAVHRSSQTARQIESQSSQNNFANHFKHIEEFKKVIDTTSEFDRHIVKNLWESVESLHKVLYPGSHNGMITPNKSLLLINTYVIDLVSKGHYPFNEADDAYDEFLRKFALILSIELNQTTRTLLKPESICRVMNFINRAISFSGIHLAPLDDTAPRDFIKNIFSFHALREACLEKMEQKSITPKEFILNVAKEELTLFDEGLGDYDLIPLAHYFWGCLIPSEQEEIVSSLDTIDKNRLDHYLKDG